VLDGGLGADTMDGGLGDDTYLIDNAGDYVWEGVGAGTDTAVASINYTLRANFENLVLTGTAASGVGNALDNRITGNASANTLTGDEGADTFVFAAALGAGNIDAITDFNVADDTIELDVTIFTGISIGALAVEAFVIGTAAADGNDRIIYDPTTGALYYDADGDGAGAAVQFATLGTGLALTNNDFLGGP
jgi:Ca2+-binding RTX toxin-like protein